MSNALRYYLTFTFDIFFNLIYKLLILKIQKTAKKNIYLYRKMIHKPKT